MNTENSCLDLNLFVGSMLQSIDPDFFTPQLLMDLSVEHKCLILSHRIGLMQGKLKALRI